MHRNLARHFAKSTPYKPADVLLAMWREPARRSPRSAQVLPQESAP